MSWGCKSGPQIAYQRNRQQVKTRNKNTVICGVYRKEQKETPAKGVERERERKECNEALMSEFVLKI